MLLRFAWIAVCAVLTVSVGCARQSWYRENATREDLASDRAACVEASGNTSGVMNLRTSLFVDRCLEERGWRELDGPSALEPAPTARSSAEPPDPRVSFDGCFERCRELTDRSKEQCFDACLAAGGDAEDAGSADHP